MSFDLQVFVNSLSKKTKEETKMGNQICEIAKDYKSKKTKNIADLPEVSVKVEVADDSYEWTDDKTQKTKVVNQKVITVNNEQYRVPASVLQQLKVLLEDNPKMQKFKVKKSGEGLDGTRYQVIPLL
jgi:hypothetical protein